MQKVFKNSKQILAFVFAFAILAVSLFAGSINVTADACDVTKIDYWDGTLASKFASGTGSEADPYIIETAEQLAYACLGQTPSTSGGKYYKVSDSIKTFVLQPEEIVDLDTLLTLEDPEAVKTYFDGLDGKINWISKFNRQSFNGNFDGNGATIYGLYATSEGTQAEDVGLFPQYDGGLRVGSKKATNTCKNIAVKNSYYYSKRRLGGIVGAAYGTNYGAKFDGKVTVDSCAISNCYMEAIGSWNFFAEQGVVSCGGNADTTVLKNILVYDVYAYNTEQKANINIIGTGGPKSGTQYPNAVSDSIFLGTAPYGIDYFVSSINEPYVYTNVVTDFPSGKVDLATPTWESKTTQRDYTDHIFSVTETGVEFKAAASMLDWKNTWFMTDNGPELRVFHDVELISTYTTHMWKCNCCGIEAAGGVTEHNFVLVGDTATGDGNDVYMCSECDYVCQHNEQSEQAYDPGDCVTASGVYTRCKFCEWYIVTDVGGIPGHKFTHITEDIGDCETLGHKEYWGCSVCNNKFTTDDVYAPMNTAVTDEELSTGFGPHDKKVDENGVEVVLYDENGHWYVCAVNDGRLDINSKDLGEAGVIKHKFEKSKCVDCGYVCIDHNYVATGAITSIHSCTNDEMSEIKCSRCGVKASVVTKPASHNIVKVEKTLPDDRMEGTKEHYKCTVCKEVYADAQGKTKVLQASLIIPKVLPEEYRDMVNADGGVTSPSTGNGGIVPMFVLAAVAGATVLATRKIKK